MTGRYTTGEKLSTFFIWVWLIIGAVLCSIAALSNLGALGGVLITLYLANILSKDLRDYAEDYKDHHEICQTCKGKGKVTKKVTA